MQRYEDADTSTTRHPTARGRTNLNIVMARLKTNDGVTLNYLYQGQGAAGGTDKR